ncbi:MAG: tetratricopeptide repeat protein [Methylovulum miyakonense]|uniref:tetratricopeptide repeat protein n=1 Tax=Methylovulum miyakonense TaxID=645578 RepID=UPI003BB58CC5
MMPISQSLKYPLICCLMISLSACNNDKQRVEYIEQGKRAFQAGDYQTSQTAFNNAISSEPENSAARFDVAEVLAGLGDIQSAAAQYQTVIQQDPRHLQARLKLGQIYLLAAKFEQAEKMAKEALAIAPDNTDAMVLMGGVFAAQNNSDAAFANAQAVLAKKPDDASATLLLASLHAKSGKSENALALLQSFVEKQPGNVTAHLMLANLYSQLGQKDKAEAQLEALVKIEPKQLEHRKRLAVFLLSQNQGDKAEAVLRSAVTDLPDNELAKLWLVEFLANQHSPEVAMAELLPMLDSGPDNYTLRFKLADLQWSQNQPDKSEETLNDIIELDKEGRQSLKARNKLARLYKATQRFDEAKALAKTILASHANDTDARILDNEIALAELKVSDALAGFRTLIAEQPNNTQVLKLLSAAHLANGEPILARENLAKVVEITPADEAARLELVNLLLQAGEKEQATGQLNALFKLNPNSKNGLEALFRIYMAQKQWDKALQMAKQLEEAYKDDASGFYMSGLVYQANGQLDKSTVSFAQALAKQPEAVEPLTQLVKSYLALKQADKAVQKLRDLIAKEPKHFYAYSLLGDIYAHENKANEAISAYQKAQDIKPEWADGYRHQAYVYLNLKQTGQALDVLNKGKAKTHNATDLVMDLVAIHHQAADHQQAIALLEELYQQQPQSLAIRQRLASYLSAYANDKEGLEKAAKVAELLEKSNSPDMLDTAGWIAYQQNNYPKAQVLLVKSNQLNAASLLNNYHLGMAYFKQGERKQAKTLLEKVINSKQKFAGLDEAKETLKALDNDNG